MRGSRLLASKRLIQSASTVQSLTDFTNEIVIAAGLDYPTVLGLVGVAWTNETDVQALFDYMPNGDLQSYLHNTQPANLSWSTTKLKFAIDIVEALVYTHSFNPPLLHRDLRTRNVLLDEDMNPKLSNFGSARFASEQNTMTTDGVGSARWLAPEILCGSTDYDAASDMYAFGVLLCELDTHKTPYEDVRDANGNAMSETAMIALVARGELRPTLSTSCPPLIRELAYECLSQDRGARPTAMRVAYELRSLKREWEEPSSVCDSHEICPL
jgi:serine/threonine-protein kinase TNNI3K